jgi:hypothetical protein
MAPENEIKTSVSEVQTHIDAYFDAVRLFASLVSELKNKGKADFSPLTANLQRIITLIKEDERILMGIANSPYSFVERKTGIDEDAAKVIVYGVNVAIYAVNISVSIGIFDDHLLYVAMASLCNHLGLADNGAFNVTETTELERTYSSELIRNISISGFDMESLFFLHGLVNDRKKILGKTSIQEAMYQYAIIISLCNSFEKLMHRRVRGEFLPPVEAMKSMREEMNGYFNKDIVRIFFNKFSIYPIGSYVKLSTKEIAKIVAINPTFIMRPVVVIVLDSNGIDKVPPQRINLREKPNYYIKHSIIDDALSERYIALF